MSDDCNEVNSKDILPLQEIQVKEIDAWVLVTLLEKHRNPIDPIISSVEEKKLAVKKTVLLKLFAPTYRKVLQSALRAWMFLVAKDKATPGLAAEVKVAGCIGQCLIDGVTYTVDTTMPPVSPEDFQILHEVDELLYCLDFGQQEKRLNALLARVEKCTSC